jgi:hypothetical protein
LTGGEILQSALSALGPVETVGTFVTGLLAGWFISWPIRRDSHLFPVVWGIALVGLLFFVSRGLSLYVDGSRLWPRNIGFSIIWTGYCIALGLGMALRRRLAK